MKGKTVTCKDLAFYLRFEGDSEPWEIPQSDKPYM